MTLGERMKAYEKLTDQVLLPGAPSVLRLDMRCAHAFCRDLDRPFDDAFQKAMQQAAAELYAAVTGAVLAYTQSDEISIAVQHTVDEREQQQFFAGRVSKITSVASSICTLAFNKAFAELGASHPELHWTAQFDCRVFNLPTPTEVHNYFVWRQQDAERNSLNMAARALYAAEELHGVKAGELHDMLMAKGVSWDDLPADKKRGAAVFRFSPLNKVTHASPKFTKLPGLIPHLFGWKNAKFVPTAG